MFEAGVTWLVIAALAFVFLVLFGFMR